MYGKKPVENSSKGVYTFSAHHRKAQAYRVGMKILTVVLHQMRS